MLIPAPISPSARDCSNTSASKPKTASAFAAASPARPPPTIAIVRCCVIGLPATTLALLALLELDAGGADPLAPAGGFIGDILAEFGGGHRHRHCAEVGE